jgi:hypothetical protein
MKIEQNEQHASGDRCHSNDEEKQTERLRPEAQIVPLPDYKSVGFPEGWGSFSPGTPEGAPPKVGGERGKEGSCSIAGLQSTELLLTAEELNMQAAEQRAHWP